MLRMCCGITYHYHQNIISALGTTRTPRKNQIYQLIMVKSWIIPQNLVIFCSISLEGAPPTQKVWDTLRKVKMKFKAFLFYFTRTTMVLLEMPALPWLVKESIQTRGIDSWNDATNADKHVSKKTGTERLEGFPTRVPGIFDCGNTVLNPTFTSIHN
jgi:hypothetical protein